jgi:hypothetical protein
VKPTKKKKSRGTGQIVERGPDKDLFRVSLVHDSSGKHHYHDETFHGKKRTLKAGCACCSRSTRLASR